ncbi:MAG: hypothetical protein JRE43_08020 [Deltaproteobacteria bacterium]|jgi:hypothetical protein|nr:hypothetical protein [Deltaproteobacteria bacterium]
MATPSATSTAIEHILGLARKERAAATRAIGAMTLDQQVALVCDTPLSRRAETLELLPAPETVIPLIPEAELCFSVKAIGIEDAAWVLDHATPEQVVACVDLDGWRGTTADRAAIDRWLDALAMTEPENFLRSIRALDPELVVLFLKHRIQCFQKPDDDEAWQPPEGSQTVEGQFYFVAAREGDDLEPVSKMLHALFVADYWVYFRMMQGIIHELDIVNEEWALRWRTGRLEDLGFPPWDRAMDIYHFIRRDDRTAISDEATSLDVGEWHLPVWMPSLPASADHQHLLFRTLAQLDESERRFALYAFISLANKVAVADRMELSDAESTPIAIDKAADFASVGLEFISTELGLDAKEVLRRVTLQRLFTVGANLEPGRAYPRDVENS